MHAYQDWLPYSVTGLPASPGLATAVRDGAWAMLDDTVNRAHAEHHGVTIRPSLVTSGAASSLIELSHGVGLVVVGSRGTGGFAGLLAGSVSTQVAMHAHAPVMVVRPPYTAVNADEVVVGVDGSPGSAAALDFAFDEANARGTALVAVTADDIAESAVERALARAGEAHPDVVRKRSTPTSRPPAS